MRAHQVESKSCKRICNHHKRIYSDSTIPQQLPKLQCHCMTHGNSSSQHVRTWQAVVGSGWDVQAGELGLLTKWDRKTHEARWRDIVEALQGVHLESLAVDEHLHKAQSGSLHRAHSGWACINRKARHADASIVKTPMGTLPMQRKHHGACRELVSPISVDMPCEDAHLKQERSKLLSHALEDKVKLSHGTD